MLELFPISALERHMQQLLSPYIEDLRELCAIDSGSGSKMGLDKVAEWLAARMKCLGMDVTIIPGETWGNDLLGVLHGEGEGIVLLLGHTDTVYPDGTAAARPLRIDGDIAYGPGVCDMKGCILSALYAIEALLASGYRSFKEIRFLCVSDEEIIDRHSKDLLRRACQDCQGVLVLEAARANGDIVSGRKGIAWYTLKAYGRSAHAGVEPEKGYSAIEELAHQTLQFLSLNGWREGVTINAGVIKGGIAPNIVPDVAEVHFDLRFLRSSDRTATEACWRNMMQRRRVQGVELALEPAADFREPMECTPEIRRLVRTAQEIADILGFPLGATTSGTSDANYVASYGIPVLDGLGPIGGLDHSPDEYLAVNSVAPRTALLAGLIAALGAGAISLKEFSQG